MDLMAVQPYVTLADYQSEEAFAAHMLRLGEEAARLRRHDDCLLVFPEDLATFLALLGAPADVGQAATLDEAFTLLGRRRPGPLLREMVRHRTRHVSVAFFHDAAPQVYGAWFRTFSQLARRLQMTVVAGSALLPQNRLGWGSDAFASRDGRIFNLALTFSPAGAVINVTLKRNLVPTQEDRLHLSPGPPSSPTPFPVGPAQVGVAICYDAFVAPHTGREPGFAPQTPLLAAAGATVVAQPSANPWPWEEAWIFAGPGDRRLRREQWQEEGLLAAMRRDARIRAGVNAQLLAALFDVHFDGQSAIYAREGDTVTAVRTAARSDADPDAETVIAWSLPF